MRSARRVCYRVEQSAKIGMLSPAIVCSLFCAHCRVVLSEFLAHRLRAVRAHASLISRKCSLHSEYCSAVQRSCTNIDYAQEWEKRLFKNPKSVDCALCCKWPSQTVVSLEAEDHLMFFSRFLSHAFSSNGYFAYKSTVTLSIAAI